MVSKYIELDLPDWVKYPIYLFSGREHIATIEKDGILVKEIRCVNCGWCCKDFKVLDYYDEEKKECSHFKDKKCDL